MEITSEFLLRDFANRSLDPEYFFARFTLNFETLASESCNTIKEYFRHVIFIVWLDMCSVQIIIIIDMFNVSYPM